MGGTHVGYMRGVYTWGIHVVYTRTRVRMYGRGYTRVTHVYAHVGAHLVSAHGGI